MIQGSCLCGAVRYQYAGELGVITICHCSDCRKAQGSTGVAAAVVEATKFQWTSGAQLIREYASSPGKKRAFCGDCGAPLYSRREDLPQVLRLRMGSIDTPIQATPSAHIFVSNLPAWAALDEDWPRYERQEPGRR
ncbi:GFA family protein [Noviherbaspirillum massiliense]|uniref:GFA family protein n=1 Tax=Noviherbaspirillum massiliense TaxID=1465823 RepID=UPI00031689CC|nr:GFA family protein [Noviherbaspirillum massiliense]